MLNNDGFNLWANTYDSSVINSDKNNQYPFAGYSKIMNAIYGAIMKQGPSKVLDIGFGTGLLASRLYEAGHGITGLDFSTEMIKIAKEKMPDANLYQWDFTLGVPEFISNLKFDFIVSTYALHHLKDDSKVDFINKLLDLLEPKGKMFIGDVCFNTMDQLLACKQDCGDNWDKDEFYFIFSEIKEKLIPRCQVYFHEFSFCSGIIEIYRS